MQSQILSQTPGQIQKVDPPYGSISYTMREARIAGSTCLDPTGDVGRNLTAQTGMWSVISN